MTAKNVGCSRQECTSAIAAERAYEEGDPALVNPSVGWAWDSLCSDPRFDDLLRRIGLEP